MVSVQVIRALRIFNLTLFHDRVAIDRGNASLNFLDVKLDSSVNLIGLRLADKRSLPCPNRNKWLEARDTLYEEIMEKAWNKEEKYFGQSYEDKDVLDSAVLIMPLVFFLHAVSFFKSFVETGYACCLYRNR